MIGAIIAKQKISSAFDALNRRDFSDYYFDTGEKFKTAWGVN
ncbi:MAG: hypothetical protein PF503_05440 [Desulfobacula sp.]|jgi:hypothetical protein|nr:hypothetical protein [Desulfobacula sp.]